MSDRLDEYRSKRDFRRTAEPSGDAHDTSGHGRRYAIQHHAASTEHWDLRLEHRGALLSWALPKGPSTDPRERRLAVRTEDHPLDYVDFEGTIPDDDYGAGAVIVWDAGTWSLRRDDADDADQDDDRIDRALDDGHLSFDVDGRKLRGGYTLQRFGEDDDQWLLIKRRDDQADARRNPTSTETASVVSGRTVVELADDPAADDDDPDDRTQRGSA